ncbi:tetratricopeptide repeat protein [Nocardia sp. NPDC052001]|uniref:tetratricopeptide repeat protein n=1 Tax=Nocardia sp. NPDC052001 TaxID=3154853 RepID=UPI00342F3858
MNSDHSDAPVPPVNQALALDRSHVRDIHAPTTINQTTQLIALSPHLTRANRIVVGEIPQQPKFFIDRGKAHGLQEAIARSRIVVVTGMRGTGKTHLAATLTREAVDAGNGLVGWINTETIDTARTGLTEIAQLLGIVDTEQDSVAATRRLKDHLSGSGAHGLLVFDNATDPDAVRALLPTAGAVKVIITTTDRSFSDMGESIDLDGYTDAEAVQFLHAATGLTDEVGALQVADALGQLPLALSAAAATITGRRLDYTRYLTLLQKKRLPDALARRAGHDHPRTVVQAVLLSLDTTIATTEPELDAAIKNLIGLMAMLSPAGVQREILTDVGDRVDEALECCVNGSILNWSDRGDAVLMHRLVARVIREQAQSDNTIGGLVTRAVDAIVPRLASREHTWATRDSTFHLIDQIDAIAKTGLAESGTEAATEAILLTRVRAAWLLRQFAEITRSITLIEPAVTDCERILGPEHPNTLGARSNLAHAYQSAGRLDKAIPLHESALANGELILGPDDPETLGFRNNLANAYQSAGRLDEAIPLHESAVADGERIFGPLHAITLAASNSLAHAYLSAGRLDKAIVLYESTLVIRQRILGPDDPETLASRNNLANAYQSAGRLKEAISAHESTLTDRERILGPDHPHTLASRNNLANAYQSAGRLKEAISAHESALADGERLLGPEDPETLAFRNNLAYAYQSARRLGEAIALYESTLVDRERILGADHPDTLASRNSLASAYESAGRLDEAIALRESTLVDRERILGPDHPRTLASRNNLAYAYGCAGQLDKCVPLLEATVADYIRILSPDHPETLAARSNLASAYQAVGRLDEATELYESTLVDRERILGPDHPETLTSRDLLARIDKSDYHDPLHTTTQVPNSNKSSTWYDRWRTRLLKRPAPHK